MLTFALFLLVVAIFLLILSQRKQKEAGVPSGKLIAIDQAGWRSLEHPLFSAKLGLTGKPDYLIEKNRRIIPIEVKTGNPTDQPYPAHIYQLAAYCLLVEETYNQSPPFGYLHYRSVVNSFQHSSKTWQIPFTPEMRTQLLDLLNEMRVELSQPEHPRSHDNPSRCAHCGYRHICDQKLE